MKHSISTLWVLVCLFIASSLCAPVSGLSQEPPGDASSTAPAEPASPAATTLAQANAQAVVPRLIKFNGTLQNLAGKPITGAVDVTFALYSVEAGGSPLWFETQTVQADSLGRYTVLLGAMTPTGLPLELFSSGEAHWLGVQVGNLPEQARALLVSVPYALKAGDAETLGGKPASAYLLASDSSSATASAAAAATMSGLVTAGGSKSLTTQSGKTSPLSITAGGTANYLAGWLNSSTLGTSAIYQDPTTNNIGIGTAGPGANLEIQGTNTTPQFRARYGAANAGLQVFGWSSTDVNFDPVVGSTKLHVGRDYSLSQLTIESGNVGIGTTGPNTPLEVVGAIHAHDSGAIADNGYPGILRVTRPAASGQYISLVRQSQYPWSIGTVYNTSDFAIGTGQVTDSNFNFPFFVIQGVTGNVGVGTPSPAAKLDVAGNINASGNVIISGPGNAIIFPDGSVMTSAGTGTNGGTITGVTAGAGLVGGGTAGNVTLYLDTTKVPTFATSSNVFSGDITAASFTGAVTGTTGTFTANTGGQVLDVTQNGSGPGLQSLTNSGASGAAAILGNASSTSGNTVGIWGQNSSSSGIALRGDNSATTGTALGIYGSSASTGGVGVQGDATATSGTTTGVLGTNASTGGTGVQGAANATTGNTFGVRGTNLSATGIGVSGEASDASGATVGVQAISNSPAGTAALLQNTGGGDILLGKQGSTTVFHVDAGGNVTANGTVTANLFSSTTGLTATNVSAMSAAFSGSNGSQIASIAQTGSGAGLLASTTSNSNGSAAVLAQATGTSGSTLGLWATNASASGIALRGDASAATGSTIGVYGSSASSSGIALRGDATATTGTTTGVVGTSAGDTGTGVEGDANSLTGNTFGVRGLNLSATGTGVSGEASDLSGVTVGVHGSVNSPAGTAAVFENLGGGNILLGKQGSNQVFLVDKDGNVTANTFTSASGEVAVGTTTTDCFTLYSSPTCFVGSSAAAIASVAQNGPGWGLLSMSNSSAAGATAIVAQATGTSGATNGVWGTNASVSGVAVRGDATATTGFNVGVYGTTSSASGTGVRGDANATTGTTVGVYGTNASNGGSAVEGDATSTTGNSVAIYGSNVSTSGIAVKGDAKATTGNTVGVYGTNTSNVGIGVRGDALASTGFTLGVYGTTPSGTGTGMKGEATSGTGATFGTYGLSWSTSGVGVQGEANSTTGSTIGVKGISASATGTGVQGSAPSIGVLGVGTGTSGYGVEGTVSSVGAIAAVFDNSAGGNLVVGSVSGVNKFRVSGTGKGYFDGGTQSSGADFAEAVDVAGSADEYEPGDVMVVDPNGQRRLALANEPYSTHVAGIYSTKPGVLATPHLMDDPRLAKEIPLAIVGIVPCKVSAENGPIRPGDLLVTSSTAGHAMKGTDRARMLGAIVGKALQPLESGMGVIEVLVTLQ